MVSPATQLCAGNGGARARSGAGEREGGWTVGAAEAGLDGQSSWGAPQGPASVFSSHPHPHTHQFLFEEGRGCFLFCLGPV